MSSVSDAIAPLSKPLRQREFELFRDLAYRTFGLELKAGKEQLVACRLRKLLRAGGFRDYTELYSNVVGDRTGESLAALIDALTTNHTSFLREKDHFEFFRDRVVPAMAARDRLEVWSAACATGEEAWSLACLLNEAAPGRKIHITATDISRRALAIAREGAYALDRCEGLPAAWLSRFFTTDPGPPKTHRVQSQLRAQATFSRLNLMDAFPWKQKFPAIFCRNVMIYFDARTQETLTAKLAACLEPGGYLFVGHAESLARIAHSLEYVRPAVYRKADRGEGAWARS